MCLFKKKPISESKKIDRSIIDQMEKFFDVIFVKIKDKEVEIELNNTRNSIHYLVPSGDKKIIAADTNLSNLLDDFKTDVIKDKLDSQEMLKRIEEINVSVALRNSKIR